MISVSYNSRTDECLLVVAATELESLACGGRMMYQAFKGQWGFSGRDFVLLCYRKDVRLFLTVEEFEMRTH